VSVLRAISDRLVAAGLANVDLDPTDTGWLILEGQTSDHPDIVNRPQIALTREGGPRRGALHAGGTSTMYPRVRAVIRGIENGYDAARVKADAVADDLHARILTVGTKQAVLFVEVEPVWLGYAEQDNKPLWSVTFRSAII
jgi:hypothetical protein